jgi:uncharacterized membrane protein
MTLIDLLILLVFMAALFFICRSIVRTYSRAKQANVKTQFPVLSISLLSISLVLVVAGLFVGLLVNDGLGSGLGGLGSFFGLLESNIRHKREARQNESLQKEPL